MVQEVLSYRETNLNRDTKLHVSQNICKERMGKPAYKIFYSIRNSEFNAIQCISKADNSDIVFFP